MRTGPYFFLAAVLCLFYSDAQAQQTPKIPRIGYVSGTGTATDQGPYVEALRQGLRDLGYIEGKTYVIEYRGAEGQIDRLAGLVEELVQLKVDLLVAAVPSAIRTAKQATKTIPILMVTGLDPVASGLVDSLAHPGGNLTGISTLSLDLSAKRLELLKEIIPALTRVGVLLDPITQTSLMTLKEYEDAAKPLKIGIQALEVHGSDPDLEASLKTAAKLRAGAVITITNANIFMQQRRLAELAIKYKLPTMFQGSTWVESGGLMSYSTDEIGAFRRAATFVDKILKGAKPAELPVERTSKFEFVVNVRTAKQIGLNIPQSVLFRADRVIK